MKGERGPKGLGSYSIVTRGDGTRALKMRVRWRGKVYVRTIDAPPEQERALSQAVFSAAVRLGAYEEQKNETKKRKFLAWLLDGIQSGKFQQAEVVELLDQLNELESGSKP